MIMWKPGQCVTIAGKQYRVTKIKEGELSNTCMYICELHHKYISICGIICGYFGRKLPNNCYLVKVKPYAKSKSAKSTSKSQ